ncbi:Laminin subunit alpha-2 [Camponotus japonicus]
MTRVTLLVTVLAAVAYISQAIPVPENVEDEQLKSKEIFEQIQPESKEILDQVRPESKEILDQNQPKFEEILDQIQSKSEENLDQPDDTSKNELEDSKNKDWREDLQKKLEILKNKSQIWGNKGIERKIERIQQKIQSRTRRNSQSAPTDILNVNEDIEKNFKDQPFNLEDVIKFFISLVHKTFSEGMKEVNQITDISPMIEKIITQRGEKDEIKEEVQKKIKENVEKTNEKIKNLEKDITDVAKEVLKNTVNFENLEKIKKGISNKLKEVTYLPKIGEAGYFLRILKIGFIQYINTSMNVIHDTFEKVKEELTKLPLIIIEAIDNFEDNFDIKQIITDIGAITFEKARDYVKEGIKDIESEKGRIGNLLKAEAERLNDKVKLQIKEVYEEGKNKVGESIGNTLKKFEDAITLNGFKDLSKGFLPKIKRD